MVDIIDLLSSPSQTSESAACQIRSTRPAQSICGHSSDGSWPSDFLCDADLAECSLKRQKTSYKSHNNLRFEDELGLPDQRYNQKRGSATTRNGKSKIDDDIIFTSSAPVSSTIRRKARNVLPSDESLPEDILAAAMTLGSSQPVESIMDTHSRKDTTAAVSVDLLSHRFDSHGSKATRQPLRSKMDMIAASIVDEIESSSQPIPNTKPIRRQLRLTEAEKEARAANKVQEKEAEKRRKRDEKEQKRREKQEAADRAEANKSKLHHKDTVSEMILVLPASLRKGTMRTMVDEFTKRLEIDVHEEEEVLDLVTGLSLKQQLPGVIIRWQRKLESVYNEELDMRTPLPKPRREYEQVLVAYFSASEFAALVAKGSSQSVTDTDSSFEATFTSNIDEHITSLKSKYEVQVKPIYLIEGLSSWLKKNKTAANRAYQERARASDILISSAPTSTTARKSKKNLSPQSDLSFLTQAHFESVFLHLQLVHKSQILQSKSASTTAENIKTITEQLSTAPYKHEKMVSNDKHASFCMDAGQVRTGDDAREVFVRMLQEVSRVTPSMAYGVANKYENVRQLSKKYKVKGPLILQDVRKAQNKDGGVSDARLGPAVSKRLYKVLTGTDPMSTDGIA